MLGVERVLMQETLLDGAGQVRRFDPQTSKQAALNVRSGALKHRILVALRDAGERGANAYELWRQCDLNGRPHSAHTRLIELRGAGFVRRTPETRPTDTPGNEGHVHVLTDLGRAVLERMERDR